MSRPLDIFRALADDVRLRVVHALMEAELSVAELVGVLKLPQSTVSRHLKPLRDAGFVETRREGTSIYYRRGDMLNDAGMVALLEKQLKTLPQARSDAAAVRNALDQRRKRSREFFEKVAGRYHSLTQPGGGWEALATALCAGFAGRDVADIGSGEGALSILLARYARSVTAIDQSPAMLRELQREAKKAGVLDRVRVAEGDLESLPLEDGAVDVVLLSQSLHHAAQPDVAVREAARILRAGGQLLILDLVKHEQDWAREKWADQWLGFEESEVEQWLRAAKLWPVSTHRIAGAAPDLPVLLAVGTKSEI